MDTPWPATATVSGPGGQQHAEGKTDSSNHEGDVKVDADVGWQAVEG